MTSLTGFQSHTMPSAVDTIGGTIPTYTTVGNAYTEFITFQCIGLPRKQIALSVATNDLTFIIEGSGDSAGTSGWYSLGEFTILAGGAHVILITNSINQMRIRVKPTVGGAHGTVAGFVRISEELTHPIRMTFAYEALTVTNAAAIGFTRTTMDSSLEVIITVEDNNVRFRLDGTAPTTTEGHLLQGGDILKVDSVVDALNFKAIATGGNAKLRVSYMR